MTDGADWADPDSVRNNTHRPFVDRTSEAETLAKALIEHKARIRAETISTRELRNVLTYFGHGGVGKSELSLRLASWLTNQDNHEDTHWGPRPSTTVNAIVRWDVNDSHGALDVVELLALLRYQLGKIQKSWPAFDLAFAEFFRVMRPGSDLRLQTPGAAQTTLSEVVGELFGDAATALGIAASGGVGAGVFGVVRRLVSGAIRATKANRTMNAYPQVATIVRECEALPASPKQTAKVAGRIAFLLSEEIHRSGPSHRPLVLVFVDHMERLQVSGKNHSGEYALNLLVARLPYFLFVVTGRNSLAWHEADATHLDARGAKLWPLLQLEPTPVDEPHQHPIGNLSKPDAERYLRGALHAAGIAVAPELVGHLASASDGWPLYLDTLVAVATDRASEKVELTETDVAGPFPKLVERLLNNLPPDQQDAFRAATILPYFDVDLVAAAADVSHGCAERLTTRTFVKANPNSTYPFRIHDNLRELVRDAGVSLDGGWAEVDWLIAARRASELARTRFRSAMDAGSDLDAVSSLALGLNIAAENGVDQAWLVPAIRESPSIKRLSVLLPSTTPRRATQELAAILEFIRLRGQAEADVTDELLELVSRRAQISSTAGLWRAYDLRSRGRIDAALAQFTQLITEFNDRPSLYRYQSAVTLRLSRRFREALELSSGFALDRKRRLRDSIDRSHGKFLGVGGRIRERALVENSRRFQLELLTDWLAVGLREGGIDYAEAHEIYVQADLVGHNTARATALGVLGQMELFDRDAVEGRLAELESMSLRRGRPYVSWSFLLAMTAFATGKMAYAERAHDIALSRGYRSSSYVAQEVLLEHLGYPLPVQETQWLEPYDEVRARWMNVLSGVVERVR